MGTGAFDIVIDAKLINESAKSCFNGDFFQESEEGTPVMHEEG